MNTFQCISNWSFFKKNIGQFLTCYLLSLFLILFTIDGSLLKFSTLLLICIFCNFNFCFLNYESHLTWTEVSKIYLFCSIASIHWLSYNRHSMISWRGECKIVRVRKGIRWQSLKMYLSYCKGRVGWLWKKLKWFCQTGNFHLLWHCK